MNKAKNTDYGYCGNAWSSAMSRIKIIEIKTNNKLGKYDASLSILDSIKGCILNTNCNTPDSLKIETLFLKFGKEKVINSFKKISRIEKRNNDKYNHIYCVSLNDLNYEFCFDASEAFFYEEKEIKNENEFYEKVKKLPFYKLLQ